MTHKRRLVISMVNAGQLEDFSTYFTIHASAEKSILLSDSMRLLTEKRDVYPRGLPDDLESISPVWNPETRTHIDSTTGIELTFEDKDYPHSILFHEQCGGGPGWSALERLQFTPKTWQSVQQRLQLLPKRYNAIHVRNSDYSTDWQDFIGSIPAHDLRRLPCLLCTDDPRVVQGARQIFKDIEFHSIYRFPSDLTEGESLHYSPKARGWEFDIGMLADLVAMARSEQLFIASHNQNNVSGFSMLAMDLHRRPHLLARLTNSTSAKLSPKPSRSLPRQHLS